MSKSVSAGAAGTEYTKSYLMLAVRKLVTRLDLLKVTISSIDTSCISNEPSKTLAQIQQELSVYKLCRQKLHLVINFAETVYEKLDEKYEVNMPRAIDSIYWAVKSVKEHLLKLADAKLNKVLDEVDGIMGYANGYIRNIALNLNKRSVERTLSIPYRVIKTEAAAEVIDISSDTDNEAKSAKPNKEVAKRLPAKHRKLKCKKNFTVVKKNSAPTEDRKFGCGIRRVWPNSENQTAPVVTCKNGTNNNSGSAETNGPVRITRNNKYNPLS